MQRQENCQESPGVATSSHNKEESGGVATPPESGQRVCVRERCEGVCVRKQKKAAGAITILREKLINKRAALAGRAQIAGAVVSSRQLPLTK